MLRPESDRWFVPPLSPERDQEHIETSADVELVHLHPISQESFLVHEGEALAPKRVEELITFQTHNPVSIAHREPMIAPVHAHTGAAQSLVIDEAENRPGWRNGERDIHDTIDLVPNRIEECRPRKHDRIAPVFIGEDHEKGALREPEVMEGEDTRGRAPGELGLAM